MAYSHRWWGPGCDRLDDCIGLFLSHDRTVGIESDSRTGLLSLHGLLIRILGLFRFFRLLLRWPRELFRIRRLLDGVDGLFPRPDVTRSVQSGPEADAGQLTMDQSSMSGI